MKCSITVYSYTPFPCPFSVLAIDLFIYYIFCFLFIKLGQKYNSVNKQGCGLTREGHERGISLLVTLL